MVSLKRILVPTDFSEFSNVAVQYAQELANQGGGRVFLLHIPGTTGENFEADFPIGPFETATQGTIKPAEKGGVGPEYAVRIGGAADEIIRYAGDREIDLIVMGTHGRGGVSHLLMGSVAEKVIRSGACPVLVVPRPRRA